MNNKHVLIFEGRDISHIEFPNGCTVWGKTPELSAALADLGYKIDVDDANNDFSQYNYNHKDR